MTELIAEFPFVSQVTEEKAKPEAWEVLSALKEASKRGGAWIPVGLAKNLLGVGRQRIYNLIEQGTLKTEKIHGHVFVSEESILEWARSERRSGRPPKNMTMMGAVKATVSWGRGRKKD